MVQEHEPDPSHPEVVGRPASGGGTETPRPSLQHWALRGLPELDQFESEEQRRAALEQISQESGTPRSAEWWIAVTILVAVTVAAMFAFRYLLRLVAWPAWVEDILRIIGYVLVFLLTLRALHRWGAAHDLRKKLLEAGVPVCRHCGYSLRGHPLDSANCPECGRPVEARVWDILRPSKSES